MRNGHTSKLYPFKIGKISFKSFLSDVLCIFRKRLAAGLLASVKDLFDLQIIFEFEILDFIHNLNFYKIYNILLFSQQV